MLIQLTFEENLGRKNLNWIIAIAQMLHGRIVQHVLVWLFLEDGLLRPQELLLRILL